MFIASFVTTSHLTKFTNFKPICQYREWISKTVVKLLTNALLHYCYLPVVLPALVGSTKAANAPKISITTALFMVTMTFKQLKS